MAAPLDVPPTYPSSTPLPSPPEDLAAKFASPESVTELMEAVDPLTILETAQELAVATVAVPVTEHMPPALSDASVPLPPRSLTHPQATSTSSEASTTQSSGDSTRPLNVSNALGYLDAVKNKFQNNPDAYNNFLEIMMDFKSQRIDRLGVIERLSTLFTGHSGS